MNVVFIMVFYTELNFFNYLSYFDFRYHELHSKSTTEIENAPGLMTADPYCYCFRHAGPYKVSDPGPPQVMGPPPR